MKVAQKEYTHQVKLSSLRLLEKNDFNFLKTEKLTANGMYFYLRNTMVEIPNTRPKNFI
jgi:hypothetical protein